MFSAISTKSVATPGSVRRSRASVVARSHVREDHVFPGFFSKRISDGRKAFESAAAEIEVAHKKNIERLDEIARRDVELAKKIIGGESGDLYAAHEERLKFVDDLSKGDVEFAKKALDLAKDTPETPAYEVIDVEFE